MRYAVQVATETERTTYYYPEKIDRMKITTRRRKIEIKNRKKNHTSKRREEREKKFKSGKEAKYKESKKPRKDTQENAQFFADFSGSHASRGV